MPESLTTKNMTPIERAARIYEQEPCARTFGEDLEAHFTTGYVISTPDLFVMGRAVSRGATREQILDPWVAFPEGMTDAWMVYLFAGDLSQVLRYLPGPKEWVAFERKNVLRFRRFKSIRRHLSCSTTTHSPILPPAAPLSSLG